MDIEGGSQENELERDYNARITERGLHRGIIELLPFTEPGLSSSPVQR